MGKGIKADKRFFNNIGRFHDAGFKNESHFLRYDMNDLRHANIHNGAGVNPIYKYQALYDNGVGELPRGRDSRNEMLDARKIQQREREFSPLIIDNPFN